MVVSCESQKWFNLYHCNRKEGEGEQALTFVFAGGGVPSSSFTVSHKHATATYWWLMGTEHPPIFFGWVLKPQSTHAVGTYMVGLRSRMEVISNHAVLIIISLSQ